MGSWIRTGASQPELEVRDFHVLVSKSFNKSVYLAKIGVLFPANLSAAGQGYRVLWERDCCAYR